MRPGAVICTVIPGRTRPASAGDSESVTLSRSSWAMRNSSVSAASAAKFCPSTALARDDPARDRRGDDDAIVAAAAPAAGGDLFARESQRDVRLLRGGARDFDFAQGSEALGVERLVAGKRGSRQLGGCGGALDLGLQTGCLAAFEDRQRLAALDAVAEIVAKVDDAARDGGGDDPRRLRIAFQQRGQFDRAAIAADRRADDFDPGSGDLPGRERDDAFVVMTGFGFGMVSGRLFLAATGGECEQERQGRNG